MSRSLQFLSLKVVSFPRVSGDEPYSTPRAPVKNPFSPRERG